MAFRATFELIFLSGSHADQISDSNVYSIESLFVILSVDADADTTSLFVLSAEEQAQKRTADMIKIDVISLMVSSYLISVWQK